MKCLNTYHGVFSLATSLGKAGIKHVPTSLRRITKFHGTCMKHVTDFHRGFQKFSKCLGRLQKLFMDMT